MSTSSLRTGLPSGSAGLAILAQLVLFRAVFSTDEHTAAFLGHPMILHCAVLARFGKPCPACGATRGFIFALHGQWGTAWHLFPVAPLAVSGLTVFGCALLALGWMQARRLPRAAALWQSIVRKASVVYAGAATAVWLGAWIAQVAS